MNKLIPLLSFSVLLLVPVGAQNAFAGLNCHVSTTLQILLDDTTNCIHVDDKHFTNFRNLNANVDPALFTVTGVTVNNEKGLQFNTQALSLLDAGALAISFDYDVISSGDPISDNTLTLDVFTSFESDPNLSPSTILQISELATSDVAQPNLIAFKTVFAQGNFISVTSDHVDYPSLFQMVSVNVAAIVNIDGLCNEVCVSEIQQFTQTFSQTPRPEVIGGEFLPIDSTALILAGAQSFSWMIPVILSVIGIGLFVVSRKFENS